MAISTLDKLYSYLKGYETCCYTGSCFEEVAKSIRLLLGDECKSLLLSDCSTQIVSDVTRQTDKFLRHYYDRMRKIKSAEVVKTLADNSKKDFSLMQDLVSWIIQGDPEQIPIECLVYMTESNQGRKCIELCTNCPYYMKNSFALYICYDESTGCDPEGLRCRWQVPEYKYLALALLKLTHNLLTIGINANNLKDYYMLYNHILSLGQIFQLMNPSDSVREKQIIDTLEMLTSKPLDANSPEYRHWDNILDEVFTDIEEGKLPYIQDIKNAMDKNKTFIESDYDYEKDPYISLKGSAQKSLTRMPYSLQSSPFEVDLLYKSFEDFDKKINYRSPYRKEPPENYDGIVMEAKTILINNPGKFKGRAIHIFDNPIQDRANFIHRRLFKLLKDLECDCTVDQEKGRKFVKQLTMDWTLTDEPDQKIGIYGADFSNATDTLDQNFQCKVLRFIFGKIGLEVSEFWRQLSTMDKYIQHTDGSYERYHQYRGQPQGCLGSFDSFALAHYFIFLIDMKTLGFENYSAKEYFRLLGDDSAYNSIKPEYEFIHGDTDENGNNRSEIEMVHFKVCTELAGFIINYDKSNSIHWNSIEAKQDFAKVTYRNGEFFSPIPFRLAMKYGTNDLSRMAVAIWRGERSEANCVRFMDTVLSDIQNDRITAIVKSGLLPFLIPFKDESIKFNSSWIARLRYSIILSYLNAFFTFIKMQDSIKDITKIDTLWYALDHIFYRYDPRSKKCIPIYGFNKEQLNDLDPNHKIWKILDHNEKIVSLLKEIYSHPNIDDQVLLILTSPLLLEKRDEFLSQLIDLVNIKNQIKMINEGNEISSFVYPDADLRLSKECKSFSEEFLSRGVAKGPRDESLIFGAVIKELQILDDQLGNIPDFVEYPSSSAS